MTKVVTRLGLYTIQLGKILGNSSNPMPYLVKHAINVLVALYIKQRQKVNTKTIIKISLPPIRKFNILKQD